MVIVCNSWWLHLFLFFFFVLGNRRLLLLMLLSVAIIFLIYTIRRRPLLAFRWQFSRLVLRLVKRHSVLKEAGKIRAGLIWPRLSVGERSLFSPEVFPTPPAAVALCIIDSCCGIIRFKTLNVVATWAVSQFSQLPSFPAIFCPPLSSAFIFYFLFGLFLEHLPTQRLALNLSSNFLFCLCVPVVHVM